MVECAAKSLYSFFRTIILPFTIPSKHSTVQKLMRMIKKTREKEQKNKNIKKILQKPNTKNKNKGKTDSATRRKSFGKLYKDFSFGLYDNII